MTPEETHQSAVQAAHEWRDQQRERVAANIAAHLPAEGELFTIRWPDGPHDFVMEFIGEDFKMAGAPQGWTYLHGRIREPEEWHGRPWSFMVHWVDAGDGAGVWTMLPMNGCLADVE